MKAIITKYALTSGVQVLEGVEPSSGVFACRDREGHLWQFTGCDWHKDKSSALGRVINMVVQKRDSLHKQLAELDAKADKALKAIEAVEL